MQKLNQKLTFSPVCCNRASFVFFSSFASYSLLQTLLCVLQFCLETSLLKPPASVLITYDADLLRTYFLRIGIFKVQVV